MNVGDLVVTADKPNILPSWRDRVGLVICVDKMFSVNLISLSDGVDFWIDNLILIQSLADEKI